MSYVLFHDYRESWISYPSSTDGLRLKYWRLREVLPNMLCYNVPKNLEYIFPTKVYWKFDATLAALSVGPYYDPYYYNCYDCFLSQTEDKRTDNIIEKCKSYCDILYSFRRLCTFINKEIAVKIDILNDESLGVLQRIAVGMLYKLPRLTKDEKILLQFNLNCNIRRARQDWLDYFCSNILHLPF